MLKVLDWSSAVLISLVLGTKGLKQLSFCHWKTAWKWHNRHKMLWQLPFYKPMTKQILSPIPVYNRCAFKTRRSYDNTAAFTTEWQRLPLNVYAHIQFITLIYIYIYEDFLFCFTFLWHSHARMKKMYIHIHRQAMHLNFKRAKLRRRQRTIYKCISYRFLSFGRIQLLCIKREKKVALLWSYLP